MAEGLEDDIAVLEEYDAAIYRWHIITYIGFSRTGGDLEIPDKRLRIRYINRKEEKIKHIEEITSIQSTIYDVFRKINELARAVNMLMDKKDEVHQLKIDLFDLVKTYERRNK